MTLHLLFTCCGDHIAQIFAFVIMQVKCETLLSGYAVSSKHSSPYFDPLVWCLHTFLELLCGHCSDEDLNLAARHS